MYSHIQLNLDNTFKRYIIADELIVWDENNYCTAFALEKDNKNERFRVYPLYTSSQPEINPMIQDVIEAEPVLINEKWTQQWLIQDLNSEQIAERFAKKKFELAITAKKIRDNLLSDSDWIVIKALEVGAPAPAEWLTYRQALRDIPQQENFPATVVWPTQPE
jgi:hypothetical protein